MAVRRFEAPEAHLLTDDVINAGSDFDTVMRLAFVAGQRTARYGPLASKAFATFLAERLPHRRILPCKGERGHE